MGLREEAVRLAKLGISRREIAKKLGIHRSIVGDWISTDYQPATIGRFASRKPATKLREDPALVERDERYHRYAHEYANPNVYWLGDPPRHRSALAQKEAERGQPG